MDETADYSLGRKRSSWSSYFMSFCIVYVQLALDKFANVRSFALALSNWKFETENRPWTEEKKQAQRRKKWAISVLEGKQKHLTGSHKKKSVSGNCDIKIQLFRERLSNKRGKAYETMSKVIMGNGGFNGCLIEPQSVSAWWKETAQTWEFLLFHSLLLNHHELQSSTAKLLLPIMPIDIVAYAFTLLLDNLWRNSCIFLVASI